jgi:serine/threonine-protein kinase
MHDQRTYGTPQDQTGSSRGRTCPTCGLIVAAGVTVCPQDGTQLVEPVSVDTEFAGKYEFIETIGAGGMGVIYKARQIMLNKFVAIKMLHEHLVSDETIQRFQLEAKAASLLSHPFIIGVHDFGTTRAGQPYMIMDYVEGITLAEALAQEGQVKFGRFLRIFAQVSDGLAHAHRKGVVHRDIKPTNIMLVRGETGQEEVRIMDFGIAKLHDSVPGAQQLTKTGEAVGSPIYMSPEQARGLKTDHLSDIYSLACAMYESLTGAPPFLGATALDTMMMHVKNTALPISEASLGNKIDPYIDALIMKMLEKEPAERPQSMDEVRDILVRSQEGALSARTMAKLTATPAAAPTNASAKNQLRVFMPLLISLVVLITAGGAFTYLFQQYKTNVKTKTDIDAEAAKSSLEAVLTPALPSGELKMTAREIFQTDVDKCNTRIDYNPERLVVVNPPTDEDMKVLSKDSCATEVVLKNTAITDRGLEYLTQPKIHLLVVDGASGLRDLHGLRQMKGLDSLSVERCDGLTHEAYDAIGGLPLLKYLSLSVTLVTDADLAKLYKLNKLGTLDITDCSNLSERAVSRLKERLPSLNVFFRTKPNAEPKIAQGTLIDQADFLNRQQKFSAAAKQYLKAIDWLTKFHPSDGEGFERCYEGLGDCYLGQHKYEDALTQFKKALEHTDRESAKGFVTRHKIAAVLEQTEKRKDAIYARHQINDEYSGMLDSSPPQERQQWALMLAMNSHLLGIDYLVVHDYVNAITSFKKGLDLLDKIGKQKSEQAANIMLSEGQVYMAMNQLHDALAALDLARENYDALPKAAGSQIPAKQRQASTFLAFLYIKLHRAPEAIFLLKEIVSKDAGDPTDQRINRLDTLIRLLREAKQTGEIDKFTAARARLQSNRHK